MHARGGPENRKFHIITYIRYHVPTGMRSGVGSSVYFTDWTMTYGLDEDFTDWLKKIDTPSGVAYCLLCRTISI